MVFSKSRCHLLRSRLASRPLASSPPGGLVRERIGYCPLLNRLSGTFCAAAGREPAYRPVLMLGSLERPELGVVYGDRGPCAAGLSRPGARPGRPPRVSNRNREAGRPSCLRARIRAARFEPRVECGSWIFRRIRDLPGKPEKRRMGSAKSGSAGTNSKHLLKSICYPEPPITLTCYLCNTRPKTREMGRFQVVPLLRVQSRSVIVVARRRGASRSRPV